MDDFDQLDIVAVLQAAITDGRAGRVVGGRLEPRRRISIQLDIGAAQQTGNYLR